MAAVDLSQPSLSVIVGSVDIAGADVAKAFTLAAVRPDYLLSLQFEGAAGRFTTDGALNDGDAMTAGFPIPADTAVEQLLPGGAGGALAKFCVAMDGAGTCHYILTKVGRL